MQHDRRCRLDGACMRRRASLAAALPHVWLRLADAHTTDGSSDEALRSAAEGARAAGACGDHTSQVSCLRIGCLVVGFAIAVVK